MKVLKFIAVVLSLIVFVLIFGLLCWPMTLMIRLACGITSASESTVRSRVARCAHFWGAIVFDLAQLILRIRVEADATVHDRSLLQNRACIVIANHQSTLDIAVLTWLVQILGLGNARWVMKRKLRRVPIIGSIATRIGNAFVARGEDTLADLGAITRCGQIALEDRAAVIIFPEGTRFDPTKTSRGFRHVLSPREKGFEELCRTMEDAPIVNVTLQWRPAILNGQTLLQIGNFYGKTLQLSVRVVGADAIGPQAAEWLVKAWRTKDRRLAARLSETV